MDKLQDYLVRSFEWSMHKQCNKPLQRLGLLPEATPPYAKLSASCYLRRWLTAWMLLVLFGLLILTACCAFDVFHTFSIHQIQKQHQAIVHIYFSIAGELASEMCILLCVEMLFATIWFPPVIWVWNRRADRLNRESSLPSAAVAAAPGVWPPPPTA